MYLEELKEVRKTLDRFAVWGYLRMDVKIKRLYEERKLKKLFIFLLITHYKSSYKIRK